MMQIKGEKERRFRHLPGLVDFRTPLAGVRQKDRGGLRARGWCAQAAGLRVNDNLPRGFDDGCER